MNGPFRAVRSPRMPGGSVSWIGVGFAVGMIIFAAAKSLVKGERRRRSGTRKPAEQPKAQMKSEPAKPSAPTASNRPPAAKAASSAPAARSSVPGTKTATPAGREEVRAQKVSVAKGTQATPKKKTAKVTAAGKKTSPGKNTNPKNPRTSPK